MNPEDWRENGTSFDYEGHEIFYIDLYSGKESNPDCVVLIHGFPTSGYDWWKVADQLSKDFRLIIPDMPGFGFSAKPKKFPYSISRQADLFERIASKLGIAQAHVLSHDYGDTVAQELLARQNQKQLSFRIISLCMLNGGLFPESYRPRLIQRLLMSSAGPVVAKLSTKNRLKKTFNKIFGPDTQPTDNEIDIYWKLMMYNNGRAVIHKTIRYMKERTVYADRWVSALQDTDVPLRLIDGLHDPISGRLLVERYRQVIPSPDVISLENIGHYPQVESPETVVKHFREFIKRIIA